MRIISIQCYKVLLYPLVSLSFALFLHQVWINLKLRNHNSSFVPSNYVHWEIALIADEDTQPLYKSPAPQDEFLLTSSSIVVESNGAFFKSYLKLNGTGWNTLKYPKSQTHTTCQKGDSVFLRWFGDAIECSGSRPQSRQVKSRTHTLSRQHSFFKTHHHIEREVLLNESCRLRSADHFPSTWHTLKIVNGKFMLEDQTINTCLKIVARSPSNSPQHPKFPFQNFPAERTIRQKRQQTASANWSLVQRGNTGVSAMQITIVNEKYALILDKVEHNPMKINGRPAWGALYHLETNEAKPLELKSNSFCAGGSFLSNGTLMSLGGSASQFKPSEFGDANGLQSIRFYTPCDDGQCPITEYDNIRLSSPRWYPTSTRLPDGSILIVGGSKEGAFRNSPKITNPTLEYFPPKKLPFALQSPGFPIFSPLLNRTLIANLFPIVITLPISNQIFIAANDEAILYNWKTNQELRLPPFPNGVRVSYPCTGSGILLPLSFKKQYIPEVLVCGGTSVNDKLPSTSYRVSDPATSQCARMVLTQDGIQKGWQVEQMPSPRIMLDLIMMPNGKVLIVNGAQSGLAGYGNLVDKVGNSNADNPNFTPVLYDPTSPENQRFSSKGMPTSTIPRLYHSSATLTPSGKVMIAGSNPNGDFSTAKYPTEYRVEWLSPPYINDPNRPVILSLPLIADYKERITVKIAGAKPSPKQIVQAVLLDLGFVTHSVHMDSRLVELETTVNSATNELQVTIPPSPEIYPPGYAWLHVLVDEIPSPGKRIMIGSGQLDV